MPVVLAPLVAFLVRALSWMFATQAILWVVKVLGLLGLAFATNEYVVEPVITHVTTAWANLPPEFALWGKALGLYEVVSLLLSAYTIMAAKKVFLVAVTK